MLDRASARRRWRAPNGDTPVAFAFDESSLAVAVVCGDLVAGAAQPRESGKELRGQSLHRSRLQIVQVVSPEVDLRIVGGAGPLTGSAIPRRSSSGGVGSWMKPRTMFSLRTRGRAHHHGLVGRRRSVAGGRHTRPTS